MLRKDGTIVRIGYWITASRVSRLPYYVRLCWPADDSPWRHGGGRERPPRVKTA
jgi:hypothetical protein